MVRIGTTGTGLTSPMSTKEEPLIDGCGRHEGYVPTVKGSKRADELMAMSASKLFVRNLAYIEGNAASISGNEADIESFVTENIIEPYKALTQN